MKTIYTAYTSKQIIAGLLRSAMLMIYTLNVKYNLRIALQQVRALIFSVGHLILVTAVAFVPWVLFPENSYRLKFLTGIIVVAIFYKPTYKLWDALLSLFLKRSSALLQKKFYALTYNLSDFFTIPAYQHSDDRE